MCDGSIRNLLRAGEPCEYVLPSGKEVKWCGLCLKCGDHYRAGHFVANKEDYVGDGNGHVAIEEGSGGDK